MINFKMQLKLLVLLMFTTLVLSCSKDKDSSYSLEKNAIGWWRVTGGDYYSADDETQNLDSIWFQVTGIKNGMLQMAKYEPVSGGQLIETGTEAEALSDTEAYSCWYIYGFSGVDEETGEEYNVQECYYLLKFKLISSNSAFFEDHTLAEEAESSRNYYTLKKLSSAPDWYPDGLYQGTD